MKLRAPLLALLLLAGLPAAACASTLYIATLDGANEVPANGSPATGFGQVVLNDPMDMITVDLSWSGLTAPATAAHIHGPAAPGTNAGVLFPLSGVPNATSGSIPEQTFAVTATEVGWLQGGLLYLNVHTANFPGGEIRGWLTAAVPEPGSLPLAAAGLAALAGWAGLAALRRRAAA